MTERKMICLDDLLSEHVGKPAWHMEAWCYENEMPETEIVKYEPLDLPTFATEMSLLAEHFNKSELSKPLIDRYFQIVSAKLNRQKFLEAVEAVYSKSLYWSQVINAITTHHESNHVPSQASYQAPVLKLAEQVVKRTK